jgi:integrase/recombinase XerC
MILLLYGAGLRSAELLSLPFDIETENALRILGKGRKERLVPLLPVVAQSIHTYRRAYIQAHNQTPERLFNGFSDRSLRRLVEGYRRQLGLPDTFTPHALRHSFATHLYQNGADLMVLADLLGHTSVSTTAIYTQVDKNSLSKMLNHCYGDRYEINVTDEKEVA